MQVKEYPPLELRGAFAYDNDTEARAQVAVGWRPEAGAIRPGDVSGGATWRKYGREAFAALSPHPLDRGSSGWFGRGVVRETQVPDDRDSIVDGDPVLLIIEDDPQYARIVLQLARDRGFKGLVALKGGLGLELARRFKPTAISLDIFLPDMLGWTVLNQLKLDPATRHIPVQIFSVAEEDRTHGLAHGAFSYLVKSSTSEGMEAALDRIRDFTEPRTRRLLVVEGNDIERSAPEL